MELLSFNLTSLDFLAECAIWCYIGIMLLIVGLLQYDVLRKAWRFLKSDELIFFGLGALCLYSIATTIIS